ncbi:hypothetical protein, partial [Enterobacter cloacae]
ANEVYNVGSDAANVHANEFYLYTILYEKYKLTFFYDSMILYKKLIDTDILRKNTAISILSR